MTPGNDWVAPGAAPLALAQNRDTSQLTSEQSSSQGSQHSVEILKVSAGSKPVAVAGAIAGVIRTQSKVEVQAIGAGAINQAIKAIAISRGYVAPGGIDLVCIPSFIDISIDGEERTGIRLLVESR